MTVWGFIFLILGSLGLVVLFFPIVLKAQFSTRPNWSWVIALGKRWTWKNTVALGVEGSADELSPGAEIALNGSAVSNSPASSSAKNGVLTSAKSEVQKVAPPQAISKGPEVLEDAQPPSKVLPGKWLSFLFDPSWHGATLRYFKRLFRYFLGIFRFHVPKLHAGGNPGDPLLTGQLCAGVEIVAATWFPRSDIAYLVDWEEPQESPWMEGIFELRFNLARLVLFIFILLFSLPLWKIWRSWRRATRNPNGLALSPGRLKLALWLSKEFAHES